MGIKSANNNGIYVGPQYIPPSADQPYESVMRLARSSFKGFYQSPGPGYHNSPAGKKKARRKMANKSKQINNGILAKRNRNRKVQLA